MSTTSTSFSQSTCRSGLTITEAYTEGPTPYRATMPTEAPLAHDAALMLETRAAVIGGLHQVEVSLGARVRAMAPPRARVTPPSRPKEFAAPHVVVAFTDSPDVRSGAKFKEQGMQVAAGVPLPCPAKEVDFCPPSGSELFGLDKLTDIDGTVERLRAHLGD